MPRALSLLMLAAVVMIIAVASSATMASVGVRIHRVVVVTAATAFAATLILIRDLDQPCAGAVHRDPTQTAFVRAQIASEVRRPLPCDRAGLPTDAPGFRAQTAPLG